MRGMVMATVLRAFTIDELRVLRSMEFFFCIVCLNTVSK